MEYSKHGNGTTSVKVHHAPGGQSNFSLGWGPEPTKPQNKPAVTPIASQPPPQQQPLKDANKVTPQTNANDAKTSVKVHNPPGGRSNITFG